MIQPPLLLLRHRPSSRKAFTLIEMLVVIAILALLAVMIVPGINRALSGARSTKCMSNLRQINLALTMYSLENRGYWPKPTGNYLNEGNPSVSWQIAIQEFIQINFPKMNQDTVLLCPEARRTYPGGEARRSYALNSAGTNGQTSRSMGMILNPSNTALVLDSGPTGGGVGDGWHTFGINTYSTVAEFRHNEGLNILFVDGSVRQLPGREAAQLEEYVRNFIY